MKIATRVAPLLLSVLGAACTGDTGATGADALVAVNPEDPGEHCPAGGLRIDTGLDDGAGGETADDGVLGAGEIDATEYVCNGDPGAPGDEGSAGNDGANGAQALIAVTDEPAGENCAFGGERIDTGLDAGDGGETAGDGVLGTGEIDATTYVCDGEDGTDGQNGADGDDGAGSLVTTTDEPPGTNCHSGGQRIDVGLDNGDGGGSAGNGVLEAGEIDDTSYVCAAPPWPAAAGIQQGLSLAALQAEGWAVCHQSTHADGLDDPVVMAGCAGDFMMLACRSGAADTLTLAAADLRSVVTQADAAQPAAHHVASGVGWYYSPDHSWGFFPAGDPVERDVCDTETTNGDLRLCWHTVGPGVGYRCGTDIDYGTAWQRLVLVK